MERNQELATEPAESLVSHVHGSWQPIETAPMDGSSFLVFCPLGESGNICQVYRFERDERFRHFASGGRWLNERPAYWMPLPEPPKE